MVTITQKILNELSKQRVSSLNLPLMTNISIKCLENVVLI